MKIIARTILAIAACGSATGVFAQLKVTSAEYVEPTDVLELRNEDGNVAVSFDIETGAEFIRRDQYCVFTPMFVSGSGSAQLPQIILEGRRHAMVVREMELFDEKPTPESYRRMTYDGENASVHYQLVVPYRPEYKDAQFVLSYVIFGAAGEVVSTESVVLANGVGGDGMELETVAETVAETATTADVDNEVSSSGGETSPHVESASEAAVVYYSPNLVQRSYVNDLGNRELFGGQSTTLDEEVFRASGYDDFLAEVTRIAADPDAQITGIEISIPALSENSIIQNRQLADGRAEAIAQRLAADLGLEEGAVTRQWVEQDPSLSVEAFSTFLLSVNYTMREYFDDQTEIGGERWAVVALDKPTPEISLNKSLEEYERNPTVSATNNVMVALMDAGRYEEARVYADAIPDDELDPAIAANKSVLLERLVR